MTLGHTRQLPIEDRYLMTRSQFNDMIATLLAGQMAERLTFSEISTGAANDIRRATELARKMVTDFGMSEKLGPRSFGEKQEMVFLGREIAEQKDYSEKVAQAIDEEVEAIIQAAHDQARKILTKHKKRLVHIAQRLMAQETIEGEELEAVFTEPIGAGEKAKAPAPPPAQPEAEPEKQPTSKKRAAPRIIPKQAPASP
jgi:cell division protease FtsH